MKNLQDAFFNEFMYLIFHWIQKQSSNHPSIQSSVFLMLVSTGSGATRTFCRGAWLHHWTRRLWTEGDRGWKNGKLALYFGIRAIRTVHLFRWWFHKHFKLSSAFWTRIFVNRHILRLQLVDVWKFEIRISIRHGRRNKKIKNRNN